jgi:hypothetical protein
MSCYPVTHNSLVYDFCPAAPTRPAERVQSMLRVRLVDEITGAGPLTPVSLEAPVAWPRAAPDGLVGLVGRPAPTFGALLPPSLTMQVRASGYVEVAVDAALGPQPGYPDSFDEIVLPDIGLHRLPVTIAGRAIARNGAVPAPVAAADIGVSGYWPTLAAVEALLPPTPASIVSLLHPLSVERGAALGAVQAQPVALAGTPKRLVDAATSGARQVRLDNVVGLAVGDLLAIDHDDPGRIEYLEITAIEALPDPQQRTRVDLMHPLVRGHLADAPARRAALGAPGPLNAIDRDAIAGDSCLFLAAAAGLPPAGVVAVVGGGPAPEYRQARLCADVTNAEGDFRLPPIARVAMVEITSNAAAFPLPVVQRLSPLYGAAENRIEVTFT